MSKWVVDPSHTMVEFTVRHMMLSRVRGKFQKFEGYLEGDPQDLSSAKIVAKIDAASVDTNEKDRDAHLRSADFFDVENHPTITFESKSLTPKGDQTYQVRGDLSIRGVTREVELDLIYEGSGKDPWGNERLGFRLEGPVNRKDFGLEWNTVLETGGVLVGDQVNLEIEAQVVRDGAAVGA